MNSIKLMYTLAAASLTVTLALPLLGQTAPDETKPKTAKAAKPAKTTTPKPAKSAKTTPATPAYPTVGSL